MKKEFEKFLREINDGKLNKAQKKLADLLGLTEASVSRWISGKAKPTDDNIIKMSKFVNKTPEEIQKIFAINSNIGDNNTISNELKDKEIELKNKEIELKDKEIELLKKELKIWELGYKINAVNKIKGGKK